MKSYNNMNNDTQDVVVSEIFVIYNVHDYQTLSLFKMVLNYICDEN